MSVHEDKGVFAPEQQIVELMAGGLRRVSLHGARQGHLALIAARLACETRFARPLLVLTAEEESARALARDIAFFLGEREDTPITEPEVLLLAAHPTSPYAEVFSDRGALLSRMTTLFRLGRPGGGDVLVCSVAALRRKVLPRELFAASSFTLSLESEIERDDLVKRLAAAGYDRCHVVDDPGTLAVRGGIVDVYPPAYRYPIRIELCGDMIDSIRLFDPATQRTLRKIEQVELYPVRETLRSPGAEHRERLLALADELHHPTRSVRNVLEEIDGGRPFLGMETLVPAFVGSMEPLWSHLPADVPWVVIEAAAVEAAWAEQEEQARRRYAARIADAKLAYPPEAFFLTDAQLEQRLAGGPCVEVQLSEVVGQSDAVVASAADNAELVAELRRARSQRGEEILSVLARHLQQLVGEGRPVMIAAGDLAHAEKLESLLRPHGVEVLRRDREAAHELLVDGTLAPGVYVHVGDLARGFRVAGGLVVISHEEIFGPKATRRVVPRASRAGLGDLGELSEGKHVVHTDHGIGRYCGLARLDVDGMQADFLLLEYAGGDRLYLPVYRMNQVQRYVGAEGAAPRLDKLGGTSWQNKKRKVQADVRRFGEELLQLYAQRASLAGHAYPQPDATFAEFEETFPFNETADQLQAISDTVKDLTTERPMDRLVCGDVGFGKTEVALRAAFLVAMSGRQVALLAPTTVLVEQHYRSFADRLVAYPLKLEVISRFRRPAELRMALTEIGSGKVDIVIGTHRLLSSDVVFKKLGMIIVDEEQRFGVAHKERLKRMRTQVDVLALTATPIPRTLQLSMVGLREISVIATAPADRLAIRTIVCRYDDELVAQAIRKELVRAGQVFFVHNEVQTIEESAKRLAEQVPEACVSVAHGQMDSRRLERVMLDFVDGKSNLLVCTTIIESGLDIPRANTMFVNRADRFGLSQLYQLRGRIGRSHRRAFCYLIVPPLERISGEARQRLELLQQFTQLGSGFSIATYDLELRGAGDLLGTRQSGHIAAVGFETYAQILEEAVAELKGEPIVRETDPELNVRVAAFIPDDFVEDTGQRLELYRRLSASCHDESALYEILAEMHDRYGSPPPEVDSLCALMVVKGLAARLRVRVVDLTESGLTLTMEQNTPLEPQRVAALVSDSSSGFRLGSEMRLIRRLSDEERAEPLRASQAILQRLLACSAQVG